MLFAEEPNVGGLIALGTVIGTVVAALGGWVITLLRTRGELQKQKRADAIAEWVSVVSTLKADLEAEKIARRASSDEVVKIRNQIFIVQESEKDCLKKYGELTEKYAVQNGVIDRLTTDIRRLQAITRDNHPGTVVPAIVIADTNGVIRDATAPVGPLFHWLPQDLRGKSIEVLIPERLRDKHKAAFAEIAAGRRETDPGKPIRAVAMRQDGKEVEVSIVLSSWTSPMGSRLITAEISQVPTPGDLAVKEQGL